MQQLSSQRSKEQDFQFFRQMSACTPVEFNGYNSGLACEQGHELEPGTKATYTPLIDIMPSNPTTMLTAMVSAQKGTEEIGQVYTVFTADQ